MKNFIQRGDTLTATAPAGGVTSGDGVLIGDMFGVAATTAAAGEKVELAVAGVFRLPKVAGAISAGAALYWSTADSAVSTTSTDGPKIGFATEDAASGDANVPVRLLGMALA